jgi:DNA modification methylase
MADDARRGRGTQTSNFGVGRRESHDAAPFYERFTPPELSSDDQLSPIAARDQIWCGDARFMDRHGEINDGSVALVVTSPPYFAGKAYEEAMGEGHVPGSYAEYLEMLRDVFDECKRKLQPGGRIAVNVANLGRKPYRSLAADVIRILQDDLKLLLRGEIIWRKAEGAGGSCAWGSFQSPANPVLRDTTERIIIASKGRFDRAKSAQERMDGGWPSAVTISVDEFLDSTLDVWNIPAESATRVGHPAPFPVALPERLIHLYTYKNDLVLDPFMGAGSTAIAAFNTSRHFVGFDTEPTYIDLAMRRYEDAKTSGLGARRGVVEVEIPPVGAEEEEGDSGFQARSSRDGKKAQSYARERLEACGFTEVEENVKLRGLGVTVNFRAVAPTGREWFFDVSGAFSSSRPGLRRTDTLWKALGRASIIRQDSRDVPLVFLTTDRPAPRSAGARALENAVTAGLVSMVVEMQDPTDIDRLHAKAQDPDFR